MIDLDTMRLFMEVVDTGGIGRAASRTGMSKSILSRRIAAMEADLGVQLLIRSVRGIQATEAGLEFRSRIEYILAEVAEARAVVAGKGSEISGRLRLTAPQLFGQRFVAPLLARLAQDYPRLQIDASFTDRVVDLTSEGFDLAIRVGEPREQSLVARRIMPVQAMLVASPDYLSAHGRPKSPADLVSHHCLIYGAGLDWKFRSGRKWSQVRPVGRLRTDDGEVILKWAEAGLGIGNVPRFHAETLVAAGRLEQVLPDCDQPEYGLYALRPPGAHPPAKVRIFIDTLVQAMTGN